MKEKLVQMILRALESARENGVIREGTPLPETVEIEEPRFDAHGDFSSNIAMVSASILKQAPRKIAEIIREHIEDPGGLIEKIEIAGPGFINFFIRPSAWHDVLRVIHETDQRYGSSSIGAGKRVQVEFVSANPTGPLHVGHGRGAAVGDTVGNILAFCGYDVQKEYYINDSGKQIRTLGLSVFLRYREKLGETIEFPETCYQGDYIRDLADAIFQKESDGLLSRDEEDAVMTCAEFAADRILEGIRKDLVDFGVTFDKWFSERTLFESGRVEEMFRKYRDDDVIYEKDGALWFRTSDYGDEKDRVVKKSDGETTYFASDIAYHAEKYERGFDRVIDVWGADHHGYVPRMTAAVEAGGIDRNRFTVILVHLVNLLRAGEPVAMSTRAGQFDTLKDVVDEVGRDAARFIFLTRHYESPLDFDLDLARKKTNDNPVYYVQYVHARISSIMGKARERGIEKAGFDTKKVGRLTNPEEIRLIRIMERYPETVFLAGEHLEPHRITYYLMDLASAFHAYYNLHKVLTDDPETTDARLCLVLAVKKVIRNGLTLLGVSAPEKM